MVWLAMSFITPRLQFRCFRSSSTPHWYGPCHGGYERLKLPDEPNQPSFPCVQLLQYTLEVLEFLSGLAELTFCRPPLVVREILGSLFDQWVGIRLQRRCCPSGSSRCRRRHLRVGWSSFEGRLSVPKQCGQ